MRRATDSTTESDTRTGAKQRERERAAHETGDRASPGDRGIAGIQRQLGNGTVQRFVGSDGRFSRTDTDVQRMCPRCRRRAREGKPLNCSECEAELQRSESPSEGRGTDAESAHESTTARDAGLTINDPDDRYEREAEAVAEAVVGMATPGTQRAGVGPSSGTDGPSPNVSPFGVGAARTASGVQRMCARCSKRLSAGKPLNCPECEEELRRKPAGPPDWRTTGGQSIDSVDASDAGGAGAVANAVEAARQGGHRLPATTRRALEPRFGYDFGDVRIHTGPRAKELSQSLNARAFTYGNDVFFAPGEYRPDSKAGRKLLAHELTHTIQQGAVDSLPGGREADPDRSAVDGDRAGGDRMRTRSSRTPSWGPSGAVGLQRAARQGGQSSSGPSTQPTTTTGTRPAERDEEQTWTEWGWETGEEMVEWGTETGRQAVEWGAEAGRALSEYGESVVVTVGDTAVEVASDVWNAAQSLADSLGGDLQWSNGSLVITVSDTTVPLDLPAAEVDPPGVGFTVPFLTGAVSIGMLTLRGTASLSAEFDPAITWDVGTPTVDRFRMVMDPFGRSVSAAGTMTLPTRLGLDAHLSAGVGGDLRAILVLPTEPPTPVVFPSVGLTGGLAGDGSGTVRNDLTLQGERSGSLGSVEVSMNAASEATVDADVGLSGWEAVEVENFELCRHYWPLWTKNLTATLAAGAGLSLSAGINGFDIEPRLSTPRVSGVDLSGLSEEAKQNLVEDDCWLCDLFRERGSFASPEQLSPYYMQPQDKLAGPLPAYPHHPYQDLGERGALFQEGTLCRGACGWNCSTCDYRDQIQVEGYDATGQRVTWTYYNVHVCSTHPACREHDACFDWAADTGGETGAFWSLLGEKHWICNIKCYCDYSATQCAGFIAGAGGDDTMYFAEHPPSPEPVEEGERAPDLPGPDNPDLQGRDGSSPSRALPFKLHKPWQGYQLFLPTLELPRARDRSGDTTSGGDPVRIDRDEGPTTVTYPTGGEFETEKFGVSPEYWPRIGQQFQFNSGRREKEKERWRKLVVGLGEDLSGLQVDHVRELQFGDETALDQFDNLWPLDSSANQSAGRLHRSEFAYYENLFGSIENRWFEITEIDIGAPYLPGELY